MSHKRPNDLISITIYSNNSQGYALSIDQLNESINFRVGLIVCIDSLYNL